MTGPVSAWRLGDQRSHPAHLAKVQWWGGESIAFIKESIDKHVYVKIESSDKCVRDGDLKITRNQLKKTKWNPNVPVGGAW